MSPKRARPHRLSAALAFALACTTRPGDAFAVASPAPHVAAVVVANCNDSGPGSLRDAVTNAVDGDTIDLSQLGCSRISLTTGALVTAANNLTLTGPGADGLTIDGAYNGGENIFFHLGTGSLSVDYMTLLNGYKYRSDLAARGGCIYSVGSVTLEAAVLENCQAHSTGAGNTALGGAVYAAQDLIMLSSAISFGIAANVDEGARGGGVYVRGTMIAKYSTIADCFAASGGSHGGSLGGGAFVYRQATIYRSTLSGNYAWHMGAMFAGAGASYPVAIYSSTISDNRAVAWAGVFANAPIKLENSTIAFNHATAPEYGGPAGVGLHVHNSTLDMESSIIGNNTNDYDTSNELVLDGNSTLLGTNNLVMSANVALPPGTLTVDPKLGALRNNGGPTMTHMQMPGSPVIDMGNDVQGVTIDQRGTGYPRTIGPAPDIGAVEYLDDDDIFWDDFEWR